MIARRDVIKGAGGLTLAATLGLPAIRTTSAAEPLTFMTPFGFVPDFLEMMNMVSGGFLAREGFSPILRGGQGTATAIQQLMAGGA
jgi:NitT/TauT family transport system substrate-binding protein